VRWLKKDATFLDTPRHPPQLRIYAGLTIKYETLLTNINENYGDNLLDELGHAIPALETLQRLAKACATIGNQLGLSPGAERAMRHGSGIDPDNIRVPVPLRRGAGDNLVTIEDSAPCWWAW
jgi:hypothetical protein